jgi:predicted small lipoprotein YifL
LFRYFSVVFILFFLVTIAACGGEQPQEFSSADLTALVNTMTAESWTITPSPTPVPSEVEIINVLNSNIRNVDKLAELVEAEYYVAKLDFLKSGNSKNYTTMRITIVCEGMIRRTCTPERGFVLLMHGFERAYGKDKQRTTISSQVPKTIQNLEVIVELAHAGSIGSFTVGWKNVESFASGELSPEQLDHEIIARP